jgi:hypothetical protein
MCVRKKKKKKGKREISRGIWKRLKNIYACFVLSFGHSQNKKNGTEIFGFFW